MDRPRGARTAAPRGLYDVLDHVKDFPPEWHALKVHEKRGDVDYILLAYDSLDSDFMEEHCLEALERMGPEEATEPMLAQANRRNQAAMRILGKIGVADDDVVDTPSITSTATRTSRSRRFARWERSERRKLSSRSRTSSQRRTRTSEAGPLARSV